MTSRLAQIPHTPAEHFKLHFFGAIVHLRERLRDVQPPPEHGERLAFLSAYLAQLDGVGHGEGGPRALAAWRRELAAWEDRATTHLPIRALQGAAGLDPETVTLLFAIGLVEEDPQFATLFDVLQGSGRRGPTVALLAGWWGERDAGDVRAGLRQLVDLGVCEVTGGDALRPDATVQVTPLAWDALRGEPPSTLGNGVQHVPRADLTALDELVAPDELLISLRALPALVTDGDVRTVIVRGPRASGRRTALGALAAELGRGVLTFGRLDAGAELPRSAGLLATLLHAVPVVELDPAPAETAGLDRPPALDAPLAVALGRVGGLGGTAIDGAITLALGLPDVAARARHWTAALGPDSGADIDELAARLRMVGGNIRRAARLARATAALDGGRPIAPADVRRASRTLGREALDTLAVALPPAGDWSRVAVDDRTREELALLELRCRHRERLQGGHNAGVRALLTGPSGTGKTLAARVLASALELDLYRIDLSTVVNKYIGETEKNLGRVLDRAEELDVALLLDEGDSLLTQRTDVQTAHDRYANLETNYLLQRLETFEGILLVTTNAPDRIDAAFQRRMDVVIDFRAPDVAERWAIWHLHLPDDHAVDPALLDEVALRCALTGGQIRNAVVHATLLGLAAGGLGSAQLDAAVRREYRKAGGVCPLRTETHA